MDQQLYRQIDRDPVDGIIADPAEKDVGPIEQSCLADMDRDDEISVDIEVDDCIGLLSQQPLFRYLCFGLIVAYIVFLILHAALLGIGPEYGVLTMMVGSAKYACLYGCLATLCYGLGWVIFRLIRLFLVRSPSVNVDEILATAEANARSRKLQEINDTYLFKDDEYELCDLESAASRMASLLSRSLAERLLVEDTDRLMAIAVADFHRFRSSAGLEEIDGAVAILNRLIENADGFTACEAAFFNGQLVQSGGDPEQVAEVLRPRLLWQLDAAGALLQALNEQERLLLGFVSETMLDEYDFRNQRLDWEFLWPKLGNPNLLRGEAGSELRAWMGLPMMACAAFVVFRRDDEVLQTVSHDNVLMTRLRNLSAVHPTIHALSRWLAERRNSAVHWNDFEWTSRALLSVRTALNNLARLSAWHGGDETPQQLAKENAICRLTRRLE